MFELFELFEILYSRNIIYYYAINILIYSVFYRYIDLLFIMIIYYFRNGESTQKSSLAVMKSQQNFETVFARNPYS